ncbi:MAG: phage head closure protein [Anaerolineae bacterium]|nr:phage head closure protein [Thermoflexales bacterium]
MQAGKLNQRVEVLGKPAAQDQYGASTRQWQVIKTLWMTVEPLAGRAFLEGKQLETEITTQMTFRKQPSFEITTLMQVRHRGITYEIVSVTNTKSDLREMVMMCRAIGQTSDV